MTFDSFVTAAIAQEAQALIGAYVDHLSQPGERDLVITFYTGRGKSRWVFSADPRLARVHQVEGKPENPPMPPNFCMVLRKWIDGARVTAVRQVGFDRVLRWEFSRSDGVHTLVAEVMGKHSNLILLDETEKVVSAIKMVPASVSRARQVLPGLPYTPPPGDRLNPLTADQAAFLRQLSVVSRQLSVPEGTASPLSELTTDPPTSWVPGQLSAETLVKTLAGFGPFAAAEVLARAGSPEPEAVWAAVSELAAATRQGRFEPMLLFAAVGGKSGRDEATGGGVARGFWAFRSVQIPGEAQEPVGSISLAAARFFGSVQRTSGEDLLRKELTSAVRKERERLERLARRLEDDLRRGGQVEQWKIAGELLASNLWRVERGQTAVEVPNYYDPEQRPLAIELDTELSPQENVERYFRRYRKGTDAALQAMEQSEAVRARLAEARGREARIAETALEGLPALREEFAGAGLLQTGTGRPGEKSAGGAGGRPVAPEYPPGVRIRRYMVEGWEVLLGENATSNDFLTTRLARPDDWWLHVRASTSAHVVVRASGHPERVPHTVLQEAARITAAHSESKHSSYVPVDYVLRKFVRKPRGSAPGLVTYRGEKTLSVEPANDHAAR